MPDLLVLFSTLGGIAAFGAIGFIVGPIIAALFVTIWEIFGKAYRADIEVEPDAGQGDDVGARNAAQRDGPSRDTRSRARSPNRSSSSTFSA